jgi:ligand-binding sensor domain-containing protein
MMFFLDKIGKINFKGKMGKQRPIFLPRDILEVAEWIATERGITVYDFISSSMRSVINPYRNKAIEERNRMQHSKDTQLQLF